MKDLISNGLTAALAQFRDDTRLYALEGDAPVFSQLFVERWTGWEALSAGFAFTIDCLSTSAHVPLEDVLGQRVTLKTRLADGSTATRTGVVADAERVGADGGLVRFRLQVVPWIHLLAQGRRSRLYQDRTVLQIVEAVFERYAPLAAWRIRDEVGPFLANIRPRSDCFQVRESDWAFVTRLLAEEGLGFHIEDDAEAPAGHRVVIFADSGRTAEEASSQAGAGVRFHRDAATEASDAIQAYGAMHTLAPTALTWLTHDYKANRALGVRAPLHNAIESVQLELYDPSGPYAFADNAEAERYIRLAAEALEAQQCTWLGLGSVRTFRAGPWFKLTQAPSEGEDAPPPEALLVAVRHLGINNLPKALQEHVEETLGPAAEDDAGAMPDLTLPPELVGFLAQTEAPALMRQRGARAEAVGYANSFRALPRDQPWRPILQDETGARWNPRPTAQGAQTAIVVGPEGETAPSGADEIYCDKLGRVRVKFHWQGDDDSPPGTAWVRVCQNWAGPNGIGIQYLPRIGMEVLVEFLDGDVDRPLIVGTVYNGQGEAGIAPTPGGQSAESNLGVYAQASDQGPSAQGNLAGGNAPAWHGWGAGDDAHRNAAALSGVKSKEFGGAGYNQAVFDDSDGQLRIQIASTQAASQFNAGHLIHQADNYRGSFRGQGWELRTDAWGAIRAEAGLWLSTYAADDSNPAGDTAPAIGLLKQAVTLLEVYSAAAGTHQTVRYASHLGVRQPDQSQLIDDVAPVKALLTSAQTTVPGEACDSALGEAHERSPAVTPERVPHSGDGLVGFAAKAGLGLIAGQSLQWLAGETLTLASGQQTNWAIAGNLRLQTGQAIGLLAGAQGGEGLRAIAAKGPVEIQAQHDQMKLQARDQLKVVSANAAVELAAGKRVVLKTTGGASLTIEGGGMTWACPGEITVHASQKSFLGPAQLSREMNSWPETQFNEGFQLRDVGGDPIRNQPYKLTRADGAILHGTTDDAGRIQLQQGLGPERVTIELLMNDEGTQS